MRFTMRSLIWLGAFVLLAGVMSTAVAHEPTYEYEIPQALVPPVIDGKLNDAIWQAFDPVEWGNINEGGEVKKEFFSYSWAAYDEENLYVAFRNMVPNPNEVVTASPGHDRDVWKDEENEIFIEPEHLGTKPYFHIMINAANTTQDAESGGIEIAWEPAIESATKKGKAEWTLEVKIPFADLNVKSAPVGDSWGWNFNRHIVTNDEDIWTSWATTGPSFHTPNRFGDLIFGSDQLAVDPRGKATTTWGRIKTRR